MGPVGSCSPVVMGKAKKAHIFMIGKPREME